MVSHAGVSAVDGGRSASGGAAGGYASIHSLIPSSYQSVWADASPLIEAACKDLQDGELVHGENFSLFAAMSALEIMDPKMDSGIEIRGFHSIEEAIENDAAPVPLSLDTTLDVQRSLDVMDHLFSCEATWHQGYSLGQTVFSCIYLLRIERTSSHALLHSYCRITRATCNAVISAVSDARTHEEEDLFTMAYGLPLKGDGDEKCLSILNSVEEIISRKLRACKAHPSKKKPLEDIEPLQANPDLEESYCNAVLSRLRFRKHFYHALMSLRKPQGRGLELAQKHVGSCLSELTNMKKSQHFLRSSLESHQDDIEVSTTASGCRPIGFDSSLNNRLSAPTPPSTVCILSWKKAIEYFEKLLHDLDAICMSKIDPVLDDALHFAVQFQKFHPDLVARAHLQILLVQDGKLYGKDFFHDVIWSALKLPQLTRDQDFEKNEFIVLLSQLVVNLFKILCTNTAWQRRKLGKILQDWSVISIQLEMAFKMEFGEASNVIVNENSMKVSRNLLLLVEEHTYWISCRFLTLGFELELFSPNEYCMVYWCMYSIFIKLVEKTQIRSASKSDNYRKKGRKRQDHTKDSGRDATISSSCLLTQCYVCLSEGLAMMLAALVNEWRVSQIESPFNGEEERFIQHFEHLLKAHIPEHVSYHQFKEFKNHARISSLLKYNYFREAQKIAASLKGRFAGEAEKLQEVQQIEQVAEHNSVALTVINQVSASNTSLQVSFEFTHHPYFVVAVVKRS